MPRCKCHLPPTITYTQSDGTQNVFIPKEELGRGSFSVVYRVIHQNENKTYAMKVIPKQQYSKSSIEGLKNEITIQKLVNHPNVVSSKYSFSDENNHYFILEYCPGRTIREYLYRSPSYRLKEPETRKILRDVIQGLIYIHNRQIVHYDLKLENFVIDCKGNVKIGDFGLSTFHKSEEGKRFSIFGTLNYLSPEMVARGSREESYKVDVWTVGVAAFIMLTGKEPFAGKTKDAVLENIRRGEFAFPPGLAVSEDAKDFVRTALQRDPRRRPTAKELLSHPFLTKVDAETVTLYKPPQTTQKVQNEDDVKKNRNLANNRQPPKVVMPLSPKISPRKVNLKAVCKPLDEVKPITVDISPEEANLKPLIPPVSIVKPLSPRVSPRKVNLKAVLQPLDDLKQVTVENSPEEANLKSVCPPSKEIIPLTARISPRETNSRPINVAKPVSPKISPRKANLKVICPQHNDLKKITAQISPREGNLNKIPFSDAKPAAASKKTFVIPSTFVSRFCFYGGNMGYLLGDGTAGVCFSDESRIVLDPAERFAQFYASPSTKYPEIIKLYKMREGEEETETVKLVKKVAKNFKKIRFSYDLPNREYDPIIPLRNVNCFVKSDDCILFKLNDMNLQINFNDHMKLIIFWDTKKMCFFRSIKDKSSLIDLKSLASMSSNSDELKKFKNAKILMSNLALTIY